ncbi:MAG: hypothetical protein LBK95_05665 [Bifidobacteriaceae bacterium]|jgi:hypothetical protein|nr:hypothetical protein [Bifidobacteriaceae bacterium]
MPFPQSAQFSTITFTGRSSDYDVADTWYPSWATDDRLYSPCTDGSLQGLWSISDAHWVRNHPLTRMYPYASTGNAVAIGDDPTALELQTLGVQFAEAYPYGGRYPCGTLVHDGVWYYGTYCLGPTATTSYGDHLYNWPQLGPFVGFRVSRDYGQTWEDCPHTPEDSIFGESGLCGYPVKIGAPHFVDFGKNMEHSPDGKAYLVAHGSDPKFYPVDNFAHLSWITGDQVHLLRVTPSVETINDPHAYEFFCGYGEDGIAVWTPDFARITPMLEWRNNMGCATMTYNRPLQKYFLCVTDGGNTCTKMNTYILEADQVSGPWSLVTYMKDFGEQAYFVNLPSKFVSADGRKMWICYSGNFWKEYEGETIASNPPGSRYGLVLQEIMLS